MKPDMLLYPDQGGYRDVPCIMLGYLSAKWDAPVIDMNLPGTSLEGGKRGSTVAAMMSFLQMHTAGRVEPLHVAVAVQSRSWGNVAKLAQEHGEWRWHSVTSPIQGMCCYKYLDWRNNIHVEKLPDQPRYDRFSSYSHFLGRWRSGEWPYAMNTTWGCPYKCTYCAARQTGWNRRSEDAIHKEICTATNLGVRSFSILDDCLNVTEKHVLMVSDIFSRFGKEWSCVNGLRADTLTEAGAYAMSRSGCRTVGFGIETSNEDLLQDIKKGETIEDIERGLAIARNNFDSVSGYLILGLPGSSYDVDAATMDWAVDQGIYLHVSFWVPEDEAGTQKDSLFYGEGAVPGPTYDQTQMQSLMNAGAGLAWGSKRDMRANLKGRWRALSQHGPRAAGRLIRMDFKKAWRKAVR